MDKIILGVYHYMDPVNASDDERREALLEEADLKNIRLVYYNNEDIDFLNGMVSGRYYENGDWKAIRTMIPRVTINISTDDEYVTDIERKLRQYTEFTCTKVQNKYFVNEKLIKSDKYSKYAIPTELVKDYQSIADMLKENKKVVLKPLNGRQGLGIYFISKKKNNYVLMTNEEEISVGEESFKLFIDELLVKEEHIVQPYIKCLTKYNEPYDFRVHVHRDGNAEWQVVKSYPRIGAKGKCLSNISRGGRTLEIEEFLSSEFGDRSKVIKQEIEDLAIELSDFIQNFSEKEINEIGVDIAIDENGNYYTYELNGGPQSKYHNKERAKYVMEYALYLYDKNKKEYISNSLKYISSEYLKTEISVLNRDFEDEVYIGILSYPNDMDEQIFSRAACYYGLEKEVNVFYFYPDDIDFNNKSISGRYYDRYMIASKKYPYPDVIIDRLRMRGFEEADYIYNEFEGIPFNIDRHGNSIVKSYSYELVKDEELRKFIIPYEKYESIDGLFKFMDEHRSIIVKPDLGTKGYGILKVDYIDGNYRVTDGIEASDFDRSQFIDYIESKVEQDSDGYIIQKYISSVCEGNRAFDCRVHLAKNGKGQWDKVNVYAKVGARNNVISNSLGGGYVGKIDPILEYKFGDRKKEILEEVIGNSFRLIEDIDKNIDNNISEVGFDVALMDDASMYLYEINLNKPAATFFEYELAEKLVSYGIYLAKKA